MVKHGSVGVMVTALLLWSSAIVAQPTVDVGPMRVAIQHILEVLWEPGRMPPGTVRIDSREVGVHMFSSPGDTVEVPVFKLGAQRDSTTQLALLNALSAEPGDARNAHECPPGASRSSCRMKDAVAVFAVSQPFQRDSVVEVFLEVRNATGYPAYPVSFSRYALTVARDGPSWVVRKRRLISIT